MWFERYVIIVTSIHRDYLPSSWSMHYPSHIDLGVYIGTIGLFFVFFLLFARFFPVLALNELKTILKSSGESYKNDTAPVHPYFAKHGHGDHGHGHDDHGHHAQSTDHGNDTGRGHSDPNAGQDTAANDSTDHRDSSIDGRDTYEPGTDNDDTNNH
jgi:hypothetical protein